MSISVQQFIERLTLSGLMSAAEISTFQNSLPPEKRPKDLHEFVQAVIQYGKLTRYQAQAVYEGKTKGLILGQYVVLDKLGEGGMGVVLKAQHRRMKRMVAIKVLSSAAMKQPGAVERFHREVEAVAKLSHPNIVAAYDADAHHGVHYLAMEYVEGSDLAAIVKQHGPFLVQQAVDCILQAARGLHYAHSKGIVHRDIKPGNLLLDKEGTVKILDMGLARIAGPEVKWGGAERLTTTGQVMGTCDYMAPEQSLDTHQADARADIYSLGCTFYRLLIGNPPYQAETFAKLFLMHLEAPIPSLCQARPEVPKALDAVCTRMLAKKPEDRYQSMAEVIADLEAALGISSSRSAHVTPPPLPPRPPPPPPLPPVPPVPPVPPPLGASSRRATVAAAAAPAEPPSENASGTWAFLQEIQPRETLTPQKQSTATERTQPHPGPDLDTASNVLGRAGATVATLGRKPLLVLGIGGGLVLLLAAALAFTLLRGTLVVEIGDRVGNGVRVAVSQAGEKIQVLDAQSGWTTKLEAGEYDLAVQGGDDQFQLDSQSITVTHGGRVKVKVTLKPASPAKPAADLKSQVAHSSKSPLPHPKSSSASPVAEWPDLPSSTQPGVAPSVASKPDVAPHSERPKPQAAKETAPAVASAAPVSKPPGPSELKAPLKKFDPPSPEEQKRLIGEIDEVYKCGEAKDQAAKAALARRLLEGGRKAMADRAEQFVLLRRAGEIACEAGEADLMLEAVSTISAAGFNIQPAQVKSRLWKRLVVQVSSGSARQISTVAASCVQFAEGAAAGGAVDEACEVLDAARNALAESKKRLQAALRAARLAIARARNADSKAATEKKAAQTQGELEEVETALDALTDSAKDLQQARHEHEAFLAARDRLKTAPNDPVACLAAGRWFCFYQGDWDGGLKLLAKGSDGALKTLASAELASKLTKAEARLARGDAWWDLAEEAAGIARNAMRRRAAHWYQQAMPDLAPGLRKSRLEERLAQADETPLTEAGGAARVRPPLAVAPFSEKTARIYQARWAKYLCLPVVQTNAIGAKLVLIPPGEFMMGSPKELIDEESKAHAEDPWYRDRLLQEGPQHRVRITRPFYLGTYPVTQEEYWRVMAANPSEFSATGKNKDKVAGQDTRRFPVEHVPWADAAEFCRKLSEMPEEKAAGRWYRLPSEAQWEYACRAGSTGRYGFSPRLQPASREDDEKSLSDYAWFDSNSGKMIHAVGGKRASAWGLYDLHGNVCQWCQDWRGEWYYAMSAADDPGGPLEGAERALRGGCYSDPAAFCRSAFRHQRSDGRDPVTGFRVCVALADSVVERAMASPAGDAAAADAAAADAPPDDEPSTTPLAPLPAVGRLVDNDGKWQLPPGVPAAAVAPFDAAKAKEHQELWAKQLGVPVEIGSSIGMKLVFIPPGEFTMGSPKEVVDEEWNAHRDDPWYTDRLPGESPQHHVRITKPFFLGRYEVTQEQYLRVMGKNPSEFAATGNRRSQVAGQDTRRFPVENVSWDEATEFCRKLSAMPQEKTAGRTYRLPSDAEWEYACRAGSAGRFSFSPADGATAESEDKKLSDYGWCSGNSREMTHAVGGKRPSPWGLYDMYGNVWEWCQDWYDGGYYAASPADDPPGPPGGSMRVTHGGGWDHAAAYCRSANRGSNSPGNRHAAVGFRVCLVLPDK
jgi:serine/threonine-protein kinase